MSASWLRILGLMVASAWLAAGCSEAKKIEVGGACILNTDCNQGLVCTWGKCHVACRASADCQPGQSCIAVSDQSMVCQMPTHCTYNSDCPTGLICAVDQQCRHQCQKDVDCSYGQTCTTTQTCAEPNQVDSNKNLLIPDGGISGSGGANPDASVDVTADVPGGGTTVSGGTTATGATSDTGGTTGAGGTTNLPDAAADVNTWTPDATTTPNQTVALFHFDGIATPTVLTDSSGTGKVATITGNPVISTTQSKFGGASLYINGNSNAQTNYVRANGGNDFLFSGDFTVDWWQYLVQYTNTFGSLIQVIASGDENTCSTCVAAGWDSISGGHGIHFIRYPVDAVTAPPLNSWHHIALTRSGSAFRAFIDGTLVATDTGIVATLGGVLEITGQNANGDNGDLNGYIDELRVVKGVAVWTSDFTPPTAPYTAADLLPPDGGALDAPAIPDGGTSGYGIPGQSCNGMTGTECNGESCCKSISVPAGTFPMGRGTETCSSCTAGCPSGMTCDLDETPEHDVTVSAFSLDKYEVTVGRFRRFVDAYDRMNAPPALDTGANPNIPGSGWREAWNGSMPADGAALKIALSCDSGYETWSEIPGSGETRAINCVSWYMAMAFCIWDGGRLPTEAEWEYVAVGGSNNDIFPWGSTPMPTCELANGPGCAGAVTSVGSYPSGSGRWGHMDLAGNVWEWALDSYSASWYSLGPVPCVDCANLSTSLSTRINRGAAFSYGNIPSWLRGASRHDNDPTLRNLSTGVRCARSP